MVKHSTGTDLVLLVGLSRNTLKDTQIRLISDKSLRPATYHGVPAPLNDWGGLYPQKTVNMIINRMRDFLKTHGKKGEDRTIPIPRRILLLYVPSHDQEKILAALDFFCHSVPLVMNEDEWAYENGSPIGWRHNKKLVQTVVYRSLRHAIRDTNTLKAEITDKRISSFALPPKNFFYPGARTAIEIFYRAFARGNLQFEDLKDDLLPARFTRDQLHHKAFKSRQNADRFFQDCRARVFPPDPYHGQARVSCGTEVTGNNGLSSDDLLEFLIFLRQHYRFGVTARSGKVHYDVQYELPRTLKGELMYCARDGNVLVTGSHANVGLNDVIWTPDGKKEPAGDN